MWALSIAQVVPCFLDVIGKQLGEKAFGSRPLVSARVFANIGPIMAHFSPDTSCLLIKNRKTAVGQKV